MDIVRAHAPPQPHTVVVAQHHLRRNQAVEAAVGSYGYENSLCDESVERVTKTARESNIPTYALPARLAVIAAWRSRGMAPPAHCPACLPGGLQRLRGERGWASWVHEDELPSPVNSVNLAISLDAALAAIWAKAGRKGAIIVG